MFGSGEQPGDEGAVRIAVLQSPEVTDEISSAAQVWKARVRRDAGIDDRDRLTLPSRKAPSLADSEVIEVFPRDYVRSWM